MADSKNPEPRSEAVVLARLLQASAVSLGIVEPRPVSVDTERAPRSDPTLYPDAGVLGQELKGNFHSSRCAARSAVP